jgi:hypothetical protein
MAKPHRARVGYLTVHPGLDLKTDKRRLNEVIEELRTEARERIAEAGLELVGEPAAMVVEGTAITLDDPRWVEEYTRGPSVGIFVEVHVRNPRAENGVQPKSGAEL